MPQPLPATIPRGNSIISRIMIAIDDSEHSARALRYVGTLLRDTHDVHVTLFHVLKPMPRKLLEHGGSENPSEEVRLATELQHDQENWVREESVMEYPILVQALELCGKTGYPRRGPKREIRNHCGDLSRIERAQTILRRGHHGSVAARGVWLYALDRGMTSRMQHPATNLG
jgi:Universal stress protein family